MITIDRWMAHAVDAWWFGCESAINVGFYVFENAATAAASQMVIARMFVVSASGVVAAPANIAMAGAPLASVAKLGSVDLLDES